MTDDVARSALVRELQRQAESRLIFDRLLLDPLIAPLSAAMSQPRREWGEASWTARDLLPSAPVHDVSLVPLHAQSA